MPAARFWRIIGVETYAGAGLELSEVALYEGATRVDAGATVASVIAPSAGSLSALQDGSFATSVAWPVDAVRLPGFALVWDFGAGVTKDVTKIGVAGPTRGACCVRAMLEYSPDGLQWSQLGPARIKHVDASSFAEFSNFDALADGVGLLTYATGTIGDASARVKKLKVAGDPAGVLPSSSVTLFGQKTIEFKGSPAGWLLAPDSGDFNFMADDFTIDGFVMPAGSGEMGVFSKRPGVSEYMPIGVYVRNNRLFILGSYSGGAWHVNVSFANGSIPIPAAVLTHFEVSRSGGVIRTFVGGEPDQTFTVGTNPLFTNTNLVSIGASAENGVNPFAGHIYGLRVLRGAARHTSAFAPPSAAYIDVDSIEMPDLRTTVDAPHLVGQEVSGFTKAVINSTLPQFDVYDAGRGRIIGTVKEKSTPTNHPLKRRVVLLAMPGSRAIRETWSDAASGAYVFDEIAMDRRYTVISYDHTGVYRGVVADNLQPELMT